MKTTKIEPFQLALVVLTMGDWLPSGSHLFRSLGSTQRSELHLKLLWTNPYEPNQPSSCTSTKVIQFYRCKWNITCSQVPIGQFCPPPPQTVQNITLGRARLNNMVFPMIFKRAVTKCSDRNVTFIKDV